MNIKEIISKTLDLGSYKELATLWIFLKEGNEYFKTQESYSELNKNEEDVLNYYMVKYNMKALYSLDDLKSKIPVLMNDVFRDGLGIKDWFIGVHDNYCEQLKIIIDKLLSLKDEEDKILNDWFDDKKMQYEEVYYRRICTEKTSYLLEEYIYIFLIDLAIQKMDDDEKKQFKETLKKAVKESLGSNAENININVAVSSAMTGGIGVLRYSMGFGFHKMLAIVANKFYSFLVGKGLSFTANWMLQKYAAIIFGTPGMIISAMLFVNDIIGLALPRNYLKYVMVVIGLYELRLKNMKNIPMLNPE